VVLCLFSEKLITKYITMVNPIDNKTIRITLLRGAFRFTNISIYKKHYIIIQNRFTIRLYINSSKKLTIPR
jgi:hypothetical protein